MSNTYVTKSGKKIVTDAYGNTTITKVQNGKKVSKTYNVSNLTAGTVVGDASHVKIGADAIHAQGRDRVVDHRNQRGNAAVVHAGGGNVRNQFNISGSVIGQMAIGNKGPTVFNNDTKHFEAGSKNVDYNISGGNFTQANIGGKATYNNKKSTVGAFGAGGAGLAGGFSFEDLAYSNMEAEDKVLALLRRGITAEQFLAILKKGHTIDKFEEAFVRNRNASVKVMVDSMLRSDEEMESEDD